MRSRDLVKDWEANEVYICEPTINLSCKGTECYVSGGQCCLTTHKEYESPYISKKAVEAITPNIASDRLPRILKKLRSQKMHAN